MSAINGLSFSFYSFYFIIFYFARINPYICNMIIFLSIPNHPTKQKYPVGRTFQSRGNDGTYRRHIHY